MIKTILLYLINVIPLLLAGNSYFYFELEIDNPEARPENFEIYRGEILSPPSRSGISYQAVAVCSIESSNIEYSFNDADNKWVFLLPANSLSKIVLKTICINKGYAPPPISGMKATDLKIIDDFDYLDRVCADAHSVIDRESGKDRFSVSGRGESSVLDYNERCVAAFEMSIYDLVENLELKENTRVQEVYYNQVKVEKLTSLPGACEVQFDDEVEILLDNGQKVLLIDFRDGNGRTDYDYPNRLVFLITCDVLFID